MFIKERYTVLLSGVEYFVYLLQVVYNYPSFNIVHKPFIVFTSSFLSLVFTKGTFKSKAPVSQLVNADDTSVIEI